MKISTSRKLDAQAKRELMMEIALKLKLEKKSNEEIAQALYQQGIGVERDDKLTPYSPKYISSVVKESLKLVAADRNEYGRQVQVILDHDLTTLIDYWMPRALGEAVDDDGNPIQPSVKAADLVRKLTADRANLVGANEAKKIEVQIEVNSALEGFVSTLKEFLSESAWDEVIGAIDKATIASQEYWQSQKQLQSAEDIIDAEVV